jgi:hypothetical protein
MDESTCTSARDALAAWMLAHAMKGAGESASVDRIRSFREELKQEKDRIRPLHWWQLVNQVFHADRGSLRPYLFPEMAWRFGEVRLDQCTVWPGEGEKAWFRGRASDLAAVCTQRKRSMRSDKVIRMSELFDVIPFDDLPLVVVRSSTGFEGFQIDDGNHRAVAAVIARRESLPAFIGTPNPFYDDYRRASLSSSPP